MHKTYFNSKNRLHDKNWCELCYYCSSTLIQNIIIHCSIRSRIPLQYIFADNNNNNINMQLSIRQYKLEQSRSIDPVSHQDFFFLLFSLCFFLVLSLSIYFRTWITQKFLKYWKIESVWQEFSVKSSLSMVLISLKINHTNCTCKTEKKLHAFHVKQINSKCNQHETFRWIIFNSNKLIVICRYKNAIVEKWKFQRKLTEILWLLAIATTTMLACIVNFNGFQVLPICNWTKIFSKTKRVNSKSQCNSQSHEQNANVLCNAYEVSSHCWCIVYRI